MRRDAHNLRIHNEGSFLLITRPQLAWLAPSAVSIYLWSNYLFFISVKSHSTTRIKRSVRRTSGKPSRRIYICNRDKRKVPKTKDLRNRWEISRGWHVFLTFLVVVLRKCSFPDERARLTRTPHFIVSSERSVSGATEIYSHYYNYELITDKQRRRADTMDKKKINSCQSDPNYRGMNEVLWKKDAREV